MSLQRTKKSIGNKDLNAIVARLRQTSQLSRSRFYKNNLDIFCQNLDIFFVLILHVVLSLSLALSDILNLFKSSKSLFGWFFRCLSARLCTRFALRTWESCCVLYIGSNIE